MKNVTIRNLPPRIAEALDREKRRQGRSLNETVIQLLAQALGLQNGAPRSNGLAKFAGRWSEDEFRQFEAAVAPFEQIDEELWR